VAAATKPDTGARQVDRLLDYADLIGTDATEHD
jgi:hypothetical protein